MKQKSENIKIGLFIDGNYLLHTSNYYNYIHPKQRRLSIGGLSQLILEVVSKDSECNKNRCLVTESHYFRGRLNAADASQRGNQLYNDRVFDDILMSEGVNAHYLPLRNAYGKKEERGIDVWLSLEAYEKAIFANLDYIALIISDADNVPLIRKLKSLGVKTILLYWEFDYINEDGQKMITKSSQELLNTVTIPVDLYKIIESGQYDGGYVDIDSLFVNQHLLKGGNENLYAISDIDNDKSSEHDKENYELGDILSLKQGYGFIKYPNNNLFFHYQDVIGDFKELIQGDSVEFIVYKNSDGQDIAKHIKKIIIDEVESSEEIDNNQFDWDNINLK